MQTLEIIIKLTRTCQIHKVKFIIKSEEQIACNPSSRSNFMEPSGINVRITSRGTIHNNGSGGFVNLISPIMSHTTNEQD